MLTDKLFGATKLPLLVKGMDAYSLRHKAIADNVANVMTHGYRRKKVEFEEHLQSARKTGTIETTRDGHIGASKGQYGLAEPKLVEEKQASKINELNNVDIDEEMSDMAQNQLQFQFAGQLSKMYFEMLNSSIRGM